MPSGLVGTIYTQINSGVKENPYFETLSDFPRVHVDMWWIGPMWPKCAFGDQKGLIWKKPCRLATPLIMGQEIADFSKILFSFLKWDFFMGQKKGVLGQKTVFWGVLDRA